MKILNFIMGLGLAVLGGACSDKEPAGEPAWGDGITVRESVALKADQPFTLNIKAPATPTLTADDAWLHASAPRTLSEGLWAVDLQAEVNPNPTERATVLHVRSGSYEATVAVKQAAGVQPEEPVTPPDPPILDPVEPRSGLTAKQLAAEMTVGINIGNTMECPGGEGDWSMRVNEQYVDGLAALGFTAVRIPCAWDSHVADRATNTIDPAWLARVDEVVGYVVARGMYAIVNIHWDGGWLERNLKEGYNADIDRKQRDYWTQIATTLGHYDQRVLFAAMNEPDATEKPGVDAIMAYQQTMIDAVRAAGGENADRVLVMQVPCTNIDQGVRGLYSLPHDPVADRLMVEAHFYDPYQYNMMEKDESWGRMWWYWGADNLVPGSNRNAEHGPDDIRRQMQKMKTHYVDGLGVPAMIGEYCVCADRSGVKGVDRDKFRAGAREWNRVTTREAKAAGCVPFFWETGGDINRADGSLRRTWQIEGVLQGATEASYPF